MTLTIRPATPQDAEDLCAVVNPIIEAGGTTAHQTPFDPARMERHYIAPPRLIACTLIANDGKTIGFQCLVWPSEEGDPFPDGWAIIATFVSAEAAGQGVGRALFAETQATARAAGVKAIDATIRADNEGGLAYYSSLGFERYDILPSVPLRDGRRIDRIRKRFTL